MPVPQTIAARSRLHRCVVVVLGAILACALPLAIPHVARATPAPQRCLRLSDGTLVHIDAWDLPHLPGQVGVYDANFGASTMSLQPVFEATATLIPSVAGPAVALPAADPSGAPGTALGADASVKASPALPAATAVDGKVREAAPGPPPPVALSGAAQPANAPTGPASVAAPEPSMPAPASTPQAPTMRVTSVLAAPLSASVSELLGDSAIPPDGLCISADGPAGAALARQLHAGDGFSVVLAPSWTARYRASTTADGLGVAHAGPGLYIYPAGTGPSAAPALRAPKAGEMLWEAVVTGGVVVALSSKEQKLPAEGFVIAAYGTGAGRDWMRANLDIGVKVTVAGDAIEVAADALRVRTAARLAWSSVTDMSATTRALRSVAEKLTGPATLSLASPNPAVVESAVLDCLRATDLASLALSLAIPVPARPAAELRAVWHRAAESNQAQVSEAARLVAESGFNCVFLETIYSGRSIYPSQLLRQNEAFKGWDPLAAWVEEAHRYGLELHTWLHTLRVTADSPVLKAHPTWAQAKADSYSSPATAAPAAVPAGLDFLDPADPAVGDFVSAEVREIAGRYAIDGVHLDYIRYGSSEALPAGYSYSDVARAAFAADTGVDPNLLRAPTGVLWREWTLWEQQRVTALVRRVRQDLLDARPQAALSAAVIGEVGAARTEKLQDWPAWVAEGLIDFAAPMLYHTDATWVGAAARKDAELPGVGTRAAVAAGVGPFLGLDSPTVAQQAQAAAGGGAQGIGLFALHSLLGGQLQMLHRGLFSSPAAVPYRGGRALDDALAAAGLPSAAAITAAAGTTGFAAPVVPGADPVIAALLALKQTPAVVCALEAATLARRWRNTHELPRMQVSLGL